jgi:hypothetical protein
MADNTTNLVRVESQFEPYEFTDEVSINLTYKGFSGQGNGAASAWRIQKIEKTGNVTTGKEPEGDQNFKFVWDDRASYTYA